jgi:TonB family protein
MNALNKVLLVAGLLLGGFHLAHAQDADKTKPPHSETVAIKIKSRPAPSYTTEARKADLQGVVRLRVTFLATGKIGNIVVAFASDEKKFEEFGLTRQAIKAAERIRFEPARRDGEPINVVKMVEYTFSTY